MNDHHGGSAGTAGQGYRIERQEHDYKPAPCDYGQRPHCICGREKNQHQPAKPARRTA